MTKHVRRNYRNHRKATWGFAIALMVAIAVVVIPIASGASDKTYTMLFPSTGAVTPTPPVSGSTTSQTLCSSSTYTVKVAITNTAKSSQLGSADVTFPANVTLSSALVAGSGANLEDRQRRLTSAALASEERRGHDYRRPRHRRRRNALRRRSSLASSNRTTSATPARTRTRTGSKTRRSRRFSFRPAPRPSPAACTTTATRAARSRSTPRRRRATSQSRGGRSHCSARRVRPLTPTSTPSSSAADGTYSVEGPIGSDYRLCVTAPNPPDSSSSWGIRAVTGVTLVAGCVPPITPTSGTSDGLSVLNLPAAGATGQDFAVVPITTPDFGADDTSTAGSYVVTAAGNTTKPPQHYVQETWTDSGGHPYFMFAPINACSGCAGKIYLLEQMSGSMKQSDLGPTHQVVLVYDDTEPFQTFMPMPYCLQDPREAGEHPARRRASFRQAQPRASSRGIRGGRRRYGRECIGRLRVRRLHVVRR